MNEFPRMFSFSNDYSLPSPSSHYKLDKEIMNRDIYEERSSVSYSSIALRKNLSSGKDSRWSKLSGLSENEDVPIDSNKKVSFEEINKKIKDLLRQFDKQPIKKKPSCASISERKPLRRILQNSVQTKNQRNLSFKRNFENHQKLLKQNDFSQLVERKSLMHIQKQSSVGKIPCRSRSGKDIDKQINRIQIRIDSFQKIKKELFKEEKTPLKPKKITKKNQDEINIPKPLKMVQKKAQLTQRSKVSESPQKQIDKLMKALLKQIQFDSQFRNIKKWFLHHSQPQKWQIISEKINLIQPKMTKKTLKQIFNLTEEEENPFYFVEQGSFDELIDAYLKSSSYWKNMIQNQFSRKDLLGEGITQIDTNKNGKIQLQDFVRYVNLESDSYFRNRDLFLVFRRFFPHNLTVSIEQILNQLCAQ